MKTFLALLLGCAGCSTFHTTQTEIAKDGTQRITNVRITSFFDAHNDVTKLRTTFTDKSQGIGVGAISENVSSTNLATILESITRGAVQGLK